ncbi:MULTISPECIES: DUF4062 domain-containing protein [Pseudoalteromonas]|uniref:DUF4062 domain-containing protein n=1 Tax=Pseudoalteromonas TaxID=53246 RepID=UPI000FFE33E6|nr:MULTISPECIES: DUF4062 domain-containing protein [Pseudoalteromonas]MCG9760201.1 DUF4062 domain-containing protein [Pseudoalteromonas sp. Isolate6]NKC21365.1 DUF4062 domain-containing protein [Pseudoalteromonas galatheae]RXE85880.1 hypothetical protein DRB05_13175 [Pseudoalteromonas sp. A757]
MAIPRVFISSTCYDLKHIRENLKYFVRTIGYEPVLSEEGAVFYNPTMHTHDSCLSEVPNCQMFVLIIGGRYGGLFREGDNSITNEEYKEAIKSKIPVFALVEQSVYSDHFLYTKNKNNKNLNHNEIVYPSADNTKIFGFIDQVRSNSINNAIVPFRDFSDIESYLRQQWAGMMFSFLSNQNEENRVSDMMSHLVGVSDKIEFLSTQVLKSVGSNESKVLVKLHDLMLDSEAIKTLLSTGHKPTLIDILTSTSLKECSLSSGGELIITTGENYVTTSAGEIDEMHYEMMEEEYSRLKANISELLANEGITQQKILEVLRDDV